MLTKLEKIAYVLLCILMADCSIFGGGRLISFGAITFRMLVLALVLLCSIPVMLKNIKIIFKNKYFISVIAFAVWVLITGIVGVMNNHRTHLILTDIKGFMYFVLIPAALCLLTSKKRVQILMKTMMYANLFAGIASITFLFIYIYEPALFHQLNEILFDAQVLFAGGVSTTILRMFYRSALYLLCGCAFGMYFYLTEKNNVRYPIIAGVCLFAILITYTRSFYLAAGIAALGIIIISVKNKDQKEAVIKFIGKTALVFGCLLVVIGVVNRTNYLEFAITRTVTTFPIGGTEDPDSTEEEDDRIDEYMELSKVSDSFREDTLRGLRRNISKSPIFGLGLGAEFKERPDGLNEYIYLDMWSKMGIVGLLLYFMPAILAIVSFVKNKDKLLSKNIHVLFTFLVLVGFMSYSLFNPFMNASLGILYYCCVLAVVNQWENTLNINR